MANCEQDCHTTPRRRPAKHAFYRALDSDKQEIRLLVVYPAANFDDPIRCSLRHLSLQKKPLPLYETISYCWGDEKLRSFLMIDQHAMDVPASSASALRRVRLIDKRRIVWIDAVCIRQDDNQEKGWQVAMMRDVYARGKCNLIYLGEDHGHAKEAVETLEMVHAEASKVVKRWDYSIRRLKARRLAFVDLRIFAEIYSREWFQRLWVLQEIRVASRNTCLLGAHFIELPKVLQVAEWILWHGPYGLGNTSKATKMLGLIDHFDYPLSHQLTMTRGFKYTVPHDRIYALGHHARLGDQVPPELRPAYDIPIHDVYRDVTRYVIEREADVRCFNYFPRRRQPDVSRNDMPSWAIDWAQEDQDGLGPMHFWAQTNAAAHRKVTVVACAVHPKLQPNYLGLEGIQIDVVSKSIPTISVQPGEDIQNLGPEIRRLFTSAVHADGKQFSRLDLAKLLIADAMSGDWSTTVLTRNFESFQAFCSQHRCLPPWRRQLRSEEDDNTKQASLYFTHLWFFWEHRNLLFTDGGRIGIGPKFTRAGDVVAILYGGKLPFILRPIGRCHQLIGNAYIHGIMDGKAVLEHEASGRPDKSFMLR